MGKVTPISNSPNRLQSELEQMVFEIDADSLSPVEALMKIYELKKIVKKVNMPVKITQSQKATGWNSFGT